tara:strand:+ start:825 stop:1550 length:726 start_codon:yes stop_codon:yes gene_type:complete
MTPLISVIIPTYNSSSTLDMALSSIVNQTYRNIEVLIIDGMSTDSTLGIARRYQKEHQNVVITSARDKGIYDAMNKGVELANGEWIYFMGSDDTFYVDDTLNEFYNICCKSNADIIYGNVYSSRFNGIHDGEFTNSKLTKKNICHQAMFFNKSIFKKKGKFNLKYKAHADWDFNISCFFSNRIKNQYYDFVVANYADGGFSSLNFDERFDKIRPFKCLLLGYNKLPSKTIKQLVKEIINKY